jgi:hypothetical protein
MKDMTMPNLPHKTDHSWTIREMRQDEVDAIVDLFFKLYPMYERGPTVTIGLGNDYSLGGMVREEIASMFTGKRYRVPFATKTLVAVRGAEATEVIGSISVLKKEARYQTAYLLCREEDERITSDLIAAADDLIKRWGGSTNIIHRKQPPWFYA